MEDKKSSNILGILTGTLTVGALVATAAHSALQAAEAKTTSTKAAPAKKLVYEVMKRGKEISNLSIPTLQATMSSIAKATLRDNDLSKKVGKESLLKLFTDKKNKDFLNQKAALASYRAMLNIPTFKLSPEEISAEIDMLSQGLQSESFAGDLAARLDKRLSALSSNSKALRFASVFRQELKRQKSFEAKPHSLLEPWGLKERLTSTHLDTLNESNVKLSTLIQEHGHSHKVIQRNLDTAKKILNKYAVRESLPQYTFHAVEDTIRGGSAIMMRIKIGSGNKLYFDLPLSANRSAYKGQVSKHGGLVYQAGPNVNQGFGSPVAASGFINKYDGPIESVEDYFLKQLDFSMSQVPGASQEKLARIKDSFIDSTFQRNQRLINMNTGPLAHNAILSTYQVKIDIPGFVAGNREQEILLQKNPNLTFIDLNQGDLAESRKLARMEIGAPTLDKLMAGTVHGDMRATAKVYSFRKTIRLDKKKGSPLKALPKMKGLLGFNNDIEAVDNIGLNRRQVLTFFQFDEEIGDSGAALAPYKRNRKLYEGSYLGRTQTIVGDPTPLKKLTHLSDEWKEILKPLYDQEKEFVRVSTETAKKTGLNIGRTETGNVLRIPLAGKVSHLIFKINKANGDLFVAPVIKRGRYNKVKSFGIKGHIVSANDEILLKEAAYTINSTPDEIKARYGTDVIVSDVDQVLRTEAGIKHAITGGFAAEASQIKGKHLDQFESFMADIYKIEQSSTQRALTLIERGREMGMTDESIARFLSGQLKYLKGNLKNALTDEQKTAIEADIKKIEDTAGDKLLNLTKGMRGFIGLETLAYDITSEYQGAGRLASIERRTLNMFVQHMRSLGLKEDHIGNVLGEFVKMNEGFTYENLVTARTYTVANKLLSSIDTDQQQYEKVMEEYKSMFTKYGDSFQHTTMDLEDVELGPDTITRHERYKKAHLMSLNLEGEAKDIAMRLWNTDKIHVPGLLGIPALENIIVKKDGKTTKITAEAEQRLSDLVGVLKNPMATANQKELEMIRYRNFLTKAAFIATESMIVGSVRGSVSARTQSLYNLDPSNAKNFERMMRLFKKDSYQSIFLSDATFMHMINSASDLKDPGVKQQVMENVHDFFFGNRYVLGTFGRHPSLGEGHAILTKGRRLLDTKSNINLIKNKAIKQFLNEKLYAKEGEEEQVLRKFLSEQVSDLKMSQEEFRAAKGEFVNILVKERKSLMKAKDYTMHLPISNEILEYELNGNKVASDKVFNHRFLRSIADTDGDTTSFIMSFSKKAKELYNGLLKDGNAARVNITGDIEFDAMQKTIKAHQSALAESATSFVADSDVEDVLKVIYAKNIGGYSEALDKLKVSVFNNNKVSKETSRQLSALMVGIEENMLKAKKMKVAVDIASAFGTAVAKKDKEAFMSLMQKHIVAANTENDIAADVMINGNTERLTTKIKFDDLFEELWSSYIQADKEGILYARSLKTPRNRIERYELTPGFEWTAKVFSSLDKFTNDLWIGKGGMIQNIVSSLAGTNTDIPKPESSASINVNVPPPSPDTAPVSSKQVTSQLEDVASHIKPKHLIGLAAIAAAAGIVNYAIHASENTTEPQTVPGNPSSTLGDVPEMQPGRNISNETYISLNQNGIGNRQQDIEIGTDNLLKSELYARTLSTFGIGSFINIHDTRKPVTKNSVSRRET